MPIEAKDIIAHTEECLRLSVKENKPDNIHFYSKMLELYTDPMKVSLAVALYNYFEGGERDEHRS